MQPVSIGEKQYLRVEWQGVVKGCPQTGFYLVQLFDWMAGEPGTSRIVRVEDMLSWHFYGSAAKMRSAHHAMSPLPPPYEHCKGVLL
jgi:hypothetical protein